MTIKFDYESYGEADLPRVGMFRYMKHPRTEILCMAVKIDDRPTEIWVPQCGPIHEWKPEIGYRAKHGDTFHAWNAGFEFLGTNEHPGQRIGMPKLHIKQMRDSAARAASLALPRSMGKCAEVLRLPIQKDEEGKRVMMKLTRPRTPTKTNSATRWTPENAPEDFHKLYMYCLNDVDTEHGVDEFLGPLSDFEQAVWELDFIINQRGVPINVSMARNIIRMRDEYLARLAQRCRQLTGYSPTQVAEVLKWVNTLNSFRLPLADYHGQLRMSALPKLDKENVDLALKAIEAGKALYGNPGAVAPVDSPIAEVLRIRQQASQTSLGKFDTILNAKDDDDRIRGMFLYWGAGPGRWAGRIAQLHNLKKPIIGHGLSKAFKDVNKGYDLPVALSRVVDRLDLKTLEMLYPKPMDALSSIIRPVIKASPTKALIVLDFSSVEARIISWLAQEEWRLEVFRTHGKIYEATASKLSGIPIEQIGKDSKERQSGKVSELALGFQGAVNALIKMGAIDKYGLKYKDLKPLVKAWREQNPSIKAMWYGIEDAVKQAMRSGQVIEAYRCRFGREGIFFHIQLPSGRMLTYVYPRLRTAIRVWNEDKDRFEHFDQKKHPLEPHMRVRIDHETGVWENYEHPGFRPQSMTQFVFEGEDAKTRQWVMQEAYGGLFTENIVQGIGACLLRQGLINTEAAGYPNIGHVHDEGIAEVFLANPGSVEDYKQHFCRLESWAEGLPIDAQGYLAPEYHKD